MSIKKNPSLGASNSTRWMACPPSVLLERGEPWETRIESDYMAEGTLAHEMSEIKLRYMNGETTRVVFREAIKKVKAHKFYLSEINKFTDDYVGVVMEELNDSRARFGKATLLIEDSVDAGDYVPDSSWIVDVAIVANGTAKIIDLKYGKGILVKAVDNSQLKLYALAILLKYGEKYTFDSFEMSIYQPRIGREPFRTDEMSRDAVFNWGEVTVRHAAALAQKGSGKLTTGSHCKQCRVAYKCPVLAATASDALVEDFPAAVDFLTDDEVLERYEKLSVVALWASAVKKHVFTEAITHDKKWTGLKLIQSTGKRKIVDPTAVILALDAKGYVEMEYLNTNLKGIGDLSDLMGKDSFEEMIEPHIQKATGGPKLVGEHVEGDPWENTAVDDFADINKDDIPF